MADVEALYGRSVCTPEEREKCAAEIGDEEYLEWACKKCEKNQGEQKGLHPWTTHLLYLRRIQKGGYPFSKNDLSAQEWLDLGLVNELIDSKKGF